ncbi:glutamate--tRNA ligase [Elasticomyces elasticus]|uniref:glutamate--tRNA ligase n=1 Tax=Exophiala sideris TaxID=1016849 RepID=A0ABR0JN29_9EURO|nr:glutamate--tRNA ligase [Elasticomyces elasticus]KAK5037901.1 glutamate--tRNA ligase [Exophiala sideris]KAK5043884.1 glutamate--tRNA ligase [Exophiala sideris]KAK5067383.1 glutamate--tRNA ligase [Exophiala sideris]KAK5182716.1 glutamate--tRNA ligase [Eurotiomycetes sp. CCFEE 6388]
MATQNAPKGKKAPKVKLMELPNAANGVVTRFPPEPSGYLHIGHSKAALLNDYFAHIQYPGGKMILRFDDTNTDKENAEFENAIREDVALLGIKPDTISYTSNYFDQIDEYCVKIIQSGKAYADDTPGDVMSAQRMAREPSVHRDDSVEDNLARFEEMKKATDEGRRWCIRAKISHANNNASLRDPVIFRCPKNQTPHHRTGLKYKAYPTYQFACPIVDSLEGITHALRTTEYNDQDAQYKWILKALELRPVFIWTFSKIQFVRTLMSKRKLTKLVNAGVVSGWDDPRFPTVRGIRRRGMTIEGLRDFMVSQGPSKNVVNMDWHTIWTMNKKVIDLQASRYTAIDNNYVICKLKGVKEEPYSEMKPKHAKYDLGEKKVWYSQNLIIEQEDARTFAKDEEITLMNWGNAYVRDIQYEKTSDKSDIADGVNALGNVSSMELELHLEGDFKATKKKITWLSKDQDLVPVELVDFDHLLSKDKLTEEEETHWEDFLTPKSEFKSYSVADCNVWNVKVDDVLQFDRKGYYRCDEAATKESPGVFFKIPSGKE